MAAIFPLISEAAFSPEVIQVLGDAWQQACSRLPDEAKSNDVKELLAKHIIELARSGERDVDRLCNGALSAGGFGQQ
jgi:hypothetical protein